MLDNNTHGLSGPDFLDAVADAEEANGNAINADVYRARARQWAADKRELENAETALSEARHQRLPCRQPIGRYAITPTDRR